MIFLNVQIVDQSNVHTNLFAQYRKLHRFVTINSNFERINHFGHASS